jgi:hypothetical protein
MMNKTAVAASVGCAALVGAVTTLGVRSEAGGNATARPAAANSTSQPTVTRPAAPVLHATTTATNAHCGQKITKSLTLNGDLNCAGTGIVVSGHNVVLNLNGHQITGERQSGTDGVRMTGRSATVKNGLVAFFDFGVRIDGKDVTVSSVRTGANGSEGILVTGDGSTITDSVAYGNPYGIFDQRTNGATYRGVHELNNSEDGLILEGGGDGGGTTVVHNIADGNVAFGIEDDSTGSTLTKNSADFNGFDGIDAHVDPLVIDGGGNHARGNDYGSGQTPEQCVYVVCS